MTNKKRPSEMDDREWRAAVEAQRARIAEVEVAEGEHAKRLKDVRATLKVEKNALDAILRGEDPIQPDPDLPFPNEPIALPDGAIDVPAPEKPPRGRRGARGPRSTMP